MHLRKSKFSSVWPKFIFRLIIFTLFMEVTRSCGPGRSGIRPRMQKRLKPLVYKQHVPNVPEKTLGASGPIDAPIRQRGDPRFKDLVPNYNADIIFKDEEGSGEDRLMTQRCKERVNTLAVSVMNLWPGVRLRITESWDNESIHQIDSLHYEGRAVDVTTSDRDSAKLGMLARLAIEAGFDWVYYESRSHIHCSVKSETSQSGKSLGCFSGDTLVTLSNGQQKLMSRLEVDDRVLTLNSQGNLEYSPVLMFMHHSPQHRTTFLRVHLESGANITITPSHLILRWQKANVTSLYEAMPVYARDVKRGELLLISRHDSERTLSVDRISDIEMLYETGVYAPLTETGTIVVNDVVASCYAVVYSQRLAHFAFAPVRFYHSMQSSFTNFYNLVRDRLATSTGNTTTVAARYAPQDGIHWYCRLLYGLTKFFVPVDWLTEM